MTEVCWPACLFSTVSTDTDRERSAFALHRCSHHSSPTTENAILFIRVSGRCKWLAYSLSLEEGWDYLTFDPASQHPYISRCLPACLGPAISGDGHSCRASRQDQAHPAHALRIGCGMRQGQAVRRRRERTEALQPCGAAGQDVLNSHCTSELLSDDDRACLTHRVV